MRHDQDRSVGALEDGPEAGDVAPDAFGAALPAGDDVLRPVGARPGAVVREQPPFEVAEADVVQFRQDEPWHVAALERQVRRFPGALELADGTQIDRRTGQMLAETSRLLPALRRQGDLELRVAVGQSANGELTLGMPGQQRLLHRAILSVNPPGG